jgi:phosphatidate cytidylyltransferase
MKRILTALILIPLVLLAVFLAPLWLFVLLSAVVAVAATWEYLGIVSAYGFDAFRVLTCLYAAALFAIYYFSRTSGLTAMIGGVLLLLLFTPFVLLSAALGRADLKSAVAGASMGYLAMGYIALPLVLLSVLREATRGWMFVLFTFLAVWVGDTAAMYVGKSMGRHKLSPRISPGKTVEGAVASLLFSIVVCCLFAHFLPEIAAGLTRIHLLREQAVSFATEAPAYVRVPVWLAAVVAAIINAMAQLGDLLESALKRGAGVKDSGSMLPGHGGILDRIDALLLAVPVALVVFLAVGSRFVR